MLSSRQRLFASPLAATLVLIAALPLGNLCLHTPARAADQPVFYLVETDAGTPSFSVPTTQTVCAEPNLVVITHGWYERQPWPGWTAKAIAQRVDRRAWRCAWYDWRPQARHWRPSRAATLGRDIVGPQLGRRIVSLSRNWQHVHLIGHSAGAWVVNAAAEIIAGDTKADIHITFLDAYVPDGWNEQMLGKVAGQSPPRCWAEHYFTRDPLNLTENVLTHAHNVDITAVNPGFKGHHFPWHWYHATVTGNYTTNARLAREPIFCETNGALYGLARAREKDERAWKETLTLNLGNKPIRIRRPRGKP
jgi:hypothetical protein